MIKLNNPDHSFMYHAHNFLTNDEAGPILDALTQGIPGLKDAIVKNHIDLHNNIMKNLNGGDLSLNDEQPLIPHALSKDVPATQVPTSQPGFPSTPYVPTNKQA